jgi:hypothetical protein
MNTKHELTRKLVETLAQAERAAGFAANPFYTSLDGKTRIHYGSAISGTEKALKWFTEAQQLLAELQRLEKEK